VAYAILSAMPNGLDLHPQLLDLGLIHEEAFSRLHENSKSLLIGKPVTTIDRDPSFKCFTADDFSQIVIRMMGRNLLQLDAG